MKIVVDENISYGKEAFEIVGEVELFHGREIKSKHLTNKDALIIRSITNVNKNLLQKTNVKFVGTATIGTDHIDKKYLSQKEIQFDYAPGCNSYAVTEYVYSAIAYITAKQNMSLEHMSLGIIGYGNIGTKVEEIAKSIGLKVIINDPPLQRENNSNYFSSLEEALSCDIITFHVPLNLDGLDKTYHLLNKNNISLIKENSILINASRGPVIDNKVLKNRLRNTKNIFAVLDVWEKEPDFDQELLDLVELGTPHIAGYSFEGKVNGTTMVYNKLCEFFNIKKVWTPDLPPVSKNKIVLDKKRSKLETLSKLFKKSYQVKNDDLAMRESENFTKKEKLSHFDSLRKNYKLRRELNNYQVQISKAEKETIKLLSSLRLNILET